MSDDEILVARRQRALEQDSPLRIRRMVVAGSQTVDAMCFEIAATWLEHPLIHDKEAVRIGLQRHNRGDYYGAKADAGHPFHEVDAILRAVLDEPRYR